MEKIKNSTNGHAPGKHGKSETSLGKNSNNAVIFSDLIHVAKPNTIAGNERIKGFFVHKSDILLIYIS